MKNHYTCDKNVRPTAPLHNLRLQIDRIKWWIGTSINDFELNFLNELESILTQLSNPSQAFTIWTEPDQRPYWHYAHEPTSGPPFAIVICQPDGTRRYYYPNK